MEVKGCSYTVMVSVGPIKGGQVETVKVHDVAGSSGPWARAALCL